MGFCVCWHWGGQAATYVHACMHKCAFSHIRDEPTSESSEKIQRERVTQKENTLHRMYYFPDPESYCTGM